MVVTAILSAIMLFALVRCVALLRALGERPSRLCRVPVPARRPYVSAHREQRCGRAACGALASHAIFVDGQSLPFDSFCANHLRAAYLDLLADNPGHRLHVRLVREARASQPCAA